MADKVAPHSSKLFAKLLGLGIFTALFTIYLTVNPSTPYWSVIIPAGIALFGTAYAIMSQVEEYVSEQAV